MTKRRTLTVTRAAEFLNFRDTDEFKKWMHKYGGGPAYDEFRELGSVCVKKLTNTLRTMIAHGEKAQLDHYILAGMRARRKMCLSYLRDRRCLGSTRAHNKKLPSGLSANKIRKSFGCPAQDHAPIDLFTFLRTELISKDQKKTPTIQQITEKAIQEEKQATKQPPLPDVLPEPSTESDKNRITRVYKTDNGLLKVKIRELISTVHASMLTGLTHFKIDKIAKTCGVRVIQVDRNEYYEIEELSVAFKMESERMADSSYSFASIRYMALCGEFLTDLLNRYGDMKSKSIKAVDQDCLKPLLGSMGWLGLMPKSAGGSDVVAEEVCERLRQAKAEFWNAPKTSNTSEKTEAEAVDEVIRANDAKAKSMTVEFEPMLVSFNFVDILGAERIEYLTNQPELVKEVNEHINNYKDELVGELISMVDEHKSEEEARVKLELEEFERRERELQFRREELERQERELEERRKKVAKKKADLEASLALFDSF